MFYIDCINAPKGVKAIKRAYIRRKFKEEAGWRAKRETLPDRRRDYVREMHWVMRRYCMWPSFYPEGE